MADLALNNGSWGLAFEPLRDDGLPTLQMRGRAVDTLRAEETATPTLMVRGEDRAMAVPARHANRVAALTTRMPVPAAMRLNQIVQHIAAEAAAGQPGVLSRELQRKGELLLSAFGSAPAELGGQLPREEYVFE